MCAEPRCTQALVHVQQLDDVLTIFVRVHNDIVQHALHKSQRDFSRSGTGRSGWIDALTNVDCQHCRITRIDEPRIELAAVDVDAVVTCLMAVRYDKQLSIRKVLLQCAQS